MLLAMIPTEHAEVLTFCFPWTIPRIRPQSPEFADLFDGKDREESSERMMSLQIVPAGRDGPSPKSSA
jgi:hypothetical protein